MSFLVAAGIGIGAGLGAMVRAGAERIQVRILVAGHAQFRARWFLTPGWSTLTVNVVGSGLLGALAAGMAQGHISHEWFLVLGAGFLGGLTTFSTLGLEIFEDLRARRWGVAAVLLTCQIVAGVGAAIAGFHLVG